MGSVYKYQITKEGLSMKLYGIGNAVLHYRLKNKLSQLQVCEGICPEMTLSRIETGEREFDSLISETLLERVGKTTNRFEFVLNDEDYYFYILRENIAKMVDAGDLESAKKYIAEYRNNMPDTHVLHEQYVLYYEALIMKTENKSEEEIVSKLYEAINLTRGDFKESTERLRLYSVIEIKIIYQLFQYEEYSENVFESLFQFVDKMYDEEDKRELLPPFLYHLGEKYEKEEKWYELEKIANQAIEILQGGRSYLYLLEFHFMQMQASFYLHQNHQKWDVQKEELRLKCNEIYYMSMGIDDVEMMGKSKCFCEEKLGCQITM